MTPRSKSRISDLQQIGKILAAVVGILTIVGIISTGLWQSIAWAQSRISEATSDERYETKARADEHKGECDTVHHQILKAVGEIRDDNKVIRQRTWDLLQRRP